MIWRGLVSRSGVVARRGLVSYGLLGDLISGVTVGALIFNDNKDGTGVVTALPSIPGAFTIVDNADGTLVVNQS